MYAPRYVAGAALALLAACSSNPTNNPTISFLNEAYLGIQAIFNRPGSVVQLSHDEQERLRVIDNFVITQFFTEDVQAVLKKSPLVVVDHYLNEAINGSIPGGTYSRNVRYLDRSEFCARRYVEDIVLHESIHYLDEKGLISDEKFLIAYERMPENNPLKVKVEDVLARYSLEHSLPTSERKAYAVEYSRMDGFDMPEELEAVFNNVLKPSIGFMIRGFIGVRFDGKTDEVLACKGYKGALRGTISGESEDSKTPERIHLEGIPEEGIDVKGLDRLKLNTQ